MARFHTLTVKEITRETADCVSIVFDIPEASKQEFSYIQGQYLTLKLHVGGEELRRSYSLCSSPVADSEVRIAVKKVDGGRASTWLNNELHTGNKLEVMTPMGNFWSAMDAANEKHYVLFAGGSGITPMLSILKTVLHSEPKSRISLFYGNRDEQAVIFKAQIDALAAQHGNRLSVFHILENPAPGTAALYTGILTAEKVAALIENHIGLNGNNEYFICGPGPMMENVKQVLTQLRIDSKLIHIEYFQAVAEAVKAAETASTQTAGTSKVTVILDGEEKVFDIPQNGSSILDVAYDAGMDVPFACKGGVCCTCRAKVTEGQVRMDHNFALTDDEVSRGYILTCQSHPVSENVVVNFDEF
ncbi:MAG: 2Fe-2S iron-sulfur cluster-binding protein [Bacteroidia bacterium]|jgi:ring-1,2-phenylacetyl-CoA epoxidase subunit PaaE|nr:2Fe-2S iron-sulfur cluster-binding protein [Bacteroidia bacterium]